MSGSKLENNAGAGWLDGGLGQDGIASGSSRCGVSSGALDGIFVASTWKAFRAVELTWREHGSGCGLFSLLSMVAAK